MVTGLFKYPNQAIAQFFLKGIADSFRIGYNAGTGNVLKLFKKNLKGAIQHPEVVDDYLRTEVSLNRVAGPYKKSQVVSMHISRFGVIPKT